MKNIFKEILYLIFSIVTSFFFYRLITLSLIDYLAIKNQFIIFISILITQTIVFYIIIRSILNKKIDKTSSIIVWIIYFLTVAFLLFGRTIIIKEINLNLIASIKDWFYDSHSIIIALFNLIMFLPTAYFFRKKKALPSLCVMILVFIGCEAIQYIFSLGMFDVGDILLYSIGFFIGLKIVKIKI